MQCALLPTATFLLLCPTSAHAQGGVPLWTNRYDGPGISFDAAQDIALDGSGNVFVTGSSGTDSSGGSATIAYLSTGVPLWTNRSEPGLYRMVVDHSGNVFVTGISLGAAGRPNPYDWVTIKYSNDGAPLWTNRYIAPDGQAAPSAIAVDSNDDVFVIGYSHNDPNDDDYATIKYSNDGVLLWSNFYNGAGNGFNSPTALAVDSSGNVFVTGKSSGLVFDHDYATIKYSGAGVPIWTNRYNGPANGDDEPRSIAVDSSGNVFVTGDLTSPLTGNRDYLTIKYSNDGVPLWTNRYNGPRNSDDYHAGIAVDASGNVFVTGSTATIKYSNAGVPLWTNLLIGPGNGLNSASDIAVDGSGNVFVLGYSLGGSATFAYSSTGVPLWTNRYDGDLSIMVVDHSGTVFVTGGSYGTNLDFVTIKYSSSGPPPRLDFQKLNNELVLSWTNAGFNLQTAPAVTGPFTNLSAATSPYTNATTSGLQFFRLKSD